MIPDWWISRDPWVIGDCIKGLEKVPDGVIDIVATDPPYNLRKKYGIAKDDLPEEEYWKWIKKVFTEIYRVMGDGYLYVTHSDKGAFSLKPILETIGFDFIQTLIWWGKNGYSIQLSRRSRSYRHEPILFLRKGEPGPLNAGERGLRYTSVIEAPRPQSNFKRGRCHPTQKPTKLFQVILMRTPGDIVLDPFLGSGTVLRAARLTGKTGLGFEIDPQYEKTIEKRSMALEGSIDDFLDLTTSEFPVTNSEVSGGLNDEAL